MFLCDTRSHFGTVTTILNLFGFHSLDLTRVLTCCTGLQIKSEQRILNNKPLTLVLKCVHFHAKKLFLLITQSGGW